MVGPRPCQALKVFVNVQGQLPRDFREENAMSSSDPGYLQWTVRRRGGGPPGLAGGRTDGRTGGQAAEEERTAVTAVTALGRISLPSGGPTPAGLQTHAFRAVPGVAARRGFPPRGGPSSGSCSPVVGSGALPPRPRARARALSPPVPAVLPGRWARTRLHVLAQRLVSPTGPKLTPAPLCAGLGGMASSRSRVHRAEHSSGALPPLPSKESIWKGRRKTKRRPLWTKREGHMRTQREGSCLQTKERETRPASQWCTDVEGLLLTTLERGTTESSQQHRPATEGVLLLQLHRAN
ncbi:uncharacterized protein [Desmodus rotundus]|uniref:uncharacterized protein n=1 Tax=Desmodus rotundus TaxID=9430 RepID=UPI002380FD18|nr:uncharacterized protein LOC128780394 [Desmodus rotundus]